MENPVEEDMKRFLDEEGIRYYPEDLKRKKVIPKFDPKTLLDRLGGDELKAGAWRLGLPKY